MYQDNNVNEKIYSEMIDAVKKLNHEKRDILMSREYKTGSSLVEKKRKIKEKGISQIAGIIKKHRKFKKGEKYSMAPFINKDNSKRTGESNYFCKDKIAVYTCIIGKYDGILEPLFKPDNVDYYAITDFEIPEDSMWKRIDVADYKSELQGMDNVLKNRFFKMHPEKVFGDYRFSVYVDGNIRICTDMTEYINRISDCGVSMFLHAQRQCVYDEARACVNMGKATKEEVDRQISHLKNEGMPENYGLPTCNVIVREHNKPRCIKMMNDWWDEFNKHVKRDQRSFPLVLYKNNIKPENMATLGYNVYRDDSFEFVNHKK